MRRPARTFALTLAFALPFTACGDAGDGTENAPGSNGNDAADTLSVVEPGKEDNFLSLTAREYAVTGATQVRIEESYAGRTAAERLARARELVSYRHVVVGWFLSQYLVEKERKDPNAKYGGFRSLTKNGSYEDLDLRPVEGDPLAFEMTFRQIVGGPVDLLSVMPTQVSPEGRRYFDLQIGRISTEDMQKLEINAEWYRQAPWEGFDPREGLRRPARNGASVRRARGPQHRCLVRLRRSDGRRRAQRRHALRLGLSRRLSLETQPRGV